MFLLNMPRKWVIKKKNKNKKNKKMKMNKKMKKKIKKKLNNSRKSEILIIYQNI
jgi:hypothetical protein